MLILLSFMSSLLIAAPLNDIKEAKKSIETLIKPLLPGLDKDAAPKALKNFRVDKCEKHKIDWASVILMQKDANLTYKFKEGCDIEGIITPKVFQSFPANLKLQHLEAYQKVETQNKITATLESKPTLNLQMRSGVLTGKKGAVKFEADYAVRVNPMDQKNMIEKNLGGELRITEIYGEKLSIKEKIMVE